MKFDQNAPGGGVETICRLENGKTFLEWRFYFAEDRDAQTDRRERDKIEANRENTGSGRGLSDKVIRVTVADREGNMAAEGWQMLGEEEPLETILIQPCLWQGISAPCLYELEASLTEQGKCLDRICRKLPLRILEADGRGEMLLNGRPFVLRAVRYTFPAFASEPMGQRLMLEDFQWLLKLGANVVCVEEREFEEAPQRSRILLRLCDRLGFLPFILQRDRFCLVCAWNLDIRLPYGEEMPSFRGEAESFFQEGASIPSSFYYRYRAKWSREPFVYLVPESVKKLKSGNYAVSCYSNCGRVALYSDGFLFELKKGNGEFVFQEIPAKSPCVRLSVEGEGCCSALSVHKSFIGQQDRITG